MIHDSIGITADEGGIVSLLELAVQVEENWYIEGFSL